jgi:hypothetical protein
MRSCKGFGLSTHIDKRRFSAYCHSFFNIDEVAVAFSAAFGEPVTINNSQGVIGP